MTQQKAPYNLGEALALIAPTVGCKPEDAREYIVIVFGKDNAAYVGASVQMTPLDAAAALRTVADTLEAGQ
jgi:hypothetical protein